MALAKVRRVGIVEFRGSADGEAEAYRVAATLLTDAGMHPHAAAARLRAAELTGGDERTLREALRFFEEEQVHDPVRYARLQVPALR